MSDSYLYWEDFVPGAIITCGPRTVTREEIIEFAEEFDPQPMHLNEKGAENSILGGLRRQRLAFMRHSHVNAVRGIFAQFQHDGGTRC